MGISTETKGFLPAELGLKDRLLVAGGMVQVGAACMRIRGTTSVLIHVSIFKLELDTRHWQVQNKQLSNGCQ